MTRQRTELRAFSVAALDAEQLGAPALCSLLNVAAPVQWPPPFNEEHVRQWFRAQLSAHPDRALWLGYYVLSDIDGRTTLVGTAGYKGPPDAQGTVEIGYSLVEAYHRRGIGTAAVSALCAFAFADVRVDKVVAETPLGFVASRRLLEKCGFRLTGQRDDPEDGALALYESRRV